MTFRGTIEELQNAVVVDRDGDKLGKVAQVYLDNDTRDPSWVTVKTGLLGTNESFVPLDKSDYADGTITVPFEKSYIKDAPTSPRTASSSVSRRTSCTATTGSAAARAGSRIPASIPPAPATTQDGRTPRAPGTPQDDRTPRAPGTIRTSTAPM